MKKLFALIIFPIILLATINDSYAKMSVKKLIRTIEKKGAVPISRDFVNDDQIYRDVLEAQYNYVIEQEKKIIYDINIAKNMCRIMGFSEGVLGKKEFTKCVLKVWETRLIGKKFKNMQTEIDEHNVAIQKYQSSFNPQAASFNQVREKQMKKNISFGKKFEKLKLKEKITNVDYGKIVTYAIGIAAAYYIGKTLGKALSKGIQGPAGPKGDTPVIIRSYRCTLNPMAFGC